VPAAGVQQAVEAATRALGKIGAVDENDVVAAQRGVPSDAGFCGAATDHENLGAERRHPASLPSGASRGTSRRRPEWTASDSGCLAQLPESNQSKVRVTARFQYL